MENRKKIFPVEESEQRLDLLLLDSISDEIEYENITRSQLKTWIEAGRVKVNGKTVLKAGYSVKAGQSIEVILPEPALSEVTPIEMPFKVLYEDDAFLAINKPAGISVHPGAGPKVPTLMNGIAWYLRDKSLPARCGIVHRLDKDTTGIVLIAKTNEMQSLLTRMFAAREVKKTYLALAFVTPRARRAVQVEESGTIITRMGRDPHNWRKMAVLETGGKEAVTLWQRIEAMSYAALLKIGLKTGRTHQIRVHLDYLRSPIIGDPLYGDTGNLPIELKRKAASFGRQALHAAKLELIHPLTKKEIVIEAPLPDDFEELIEAFRNYIG